MSAESDARTRARLLNHNETRMRSLTGTPEDALHAAEDRLAFSIAALTESAATNSNRIQVEKDLKEIPLLEAKLAASISGETPLVDVGKVKNFYTLARDLDEPNDFGARLDDILKQVDETCAALPVNDRLFLQQDIISKFSPRVEQTICKGPDQDEIAAIFGKPYEPGSLCDSFAKADASMPEGVKALKKMMEALSGDVNDGFGRLYDMRVQEREAAREAERAARRMGVPGASA